MNSSFLIFCCFLLAGQFVSGEVIKYGSCSDDSNEFPCDISEVRVKPCKESKACRVKRGTTANISFDYTPTFGGNITCGAFWNNLAWQGLDTDGCKFTECPVAENAKNTFSYDLYLAKTLPVGLYEVAWKIWNESNQTCCFLFKVKLVK